MVLRAGTPEDDLAHVDDALVTSVSDARAPLALTDSQVQVAQVSAAQVAHGTFEPSPNCCSKRTSKEPYGTSTSGRTHPQIVAGDKADAFTQVCTVVVTVSVVTA